MTGLRIQARGLRRTYPARAGSPEIDALGPLDLDIAPGEFFSVIGPSGCGKSTLLEILAGLARPTAGALSHDATAHSGVPPDVGVVFQQDASFPWLSVRDNIAFPLRGKFDRTEIDQRVLAAVAVVGLSEFLDAYPAALSGGMRQRVCLARTLVTRPRLILLDEPFAALDAQTRLLLGDELLDAWRASGATVVLITHALDEAAALSDRIAVMSARPGRIVETIATGWPRDRTSAVAAESRFGTLTSRLWGLLRKEAIVAMGRDTSIANGAA